MIIGNYKPITEVTYSPRHISWASGPSLPFNVGKNWKKHVSFIARTIRTLFNATLGGKNIQMIEQLNEDLSLSVPTNYLGVAAKYRNAVSSVDLQWGSNARAQSIKLSQA